MKKIILDILFEFLLKISRYEKNESGILTINYYVLYNYSVVVFVLLLLFFLLLKIRKMREKIKEISGKNRENTEFVRRVINNSPSMYSVKDRYGEIFLANKSYSEFFNKSIEEVEGKTVNELFIELGYDYEFSKRMTKDEIEVIKGRKGKFGIEEKILLPNGEEKWFYSNIVPLKMDLGLYYSLRVSNDITQRKNAEIALEKAKEQAEKTSIEKGHFLATMSHEIRTPLNGIITMLEQINLKKSHKLDFLNKELEIMNISAKRLVEVVEDVLSLSKIEYGEIKSETDEFNIRTEIKNGILIFEEKIKEKKLDILTYVDKNIPALIKGDLIKYHQILTNIFGNAIKYTKEGYISIELKLLSKEDKKIFIRTVIKDTGIGISKENHLNIFKKFSQIDQNLTKNTGGVGLGLAIVKELVKRMDGKIYLESEDGEGSTFIIDIPFVVLKENENLKIKNKELIVLSDKILYVDNYIKNIRNIEGLSFIVVDDIKEFYAVLEGKKLSETYVLIDLENENLEKIIKDFDNRVILIKNSKNIGSVSDDLKISREFLEEKLKNTFDLEHGEIEEKVYIQKKGTENFVKILLVEDDFINREAFKIILESIGINEVHMAVDGEDALEYYYANSYDMIFMDLGLPKLNGFEVLEKIRDYEKENNKQNSIIITLTANALEGDREKCLNAGFDDYLTKPLTREKLLEKIEYYYNNKTLDFEELKSQYNDNRIILKKLLDSFVRNLPLLIEELSRSIKNENSENILEKLHKLKGAVGNLGDKNILKTIELMEFTYKNSNQKKGEMQYKKLLNELEHLISLTKKELDSF